MHCNKSVVFMIVSEPDIP